MQLNSVLQANQWVARYVCTVNGPQDAVWWHATLYIQESAYSAGSGLTKGLAMEEAAENALCIIAQQTDVQPVRQRTRRP